MSIKFCADLLISFKDKNQGAILAFNRNYNENLGWY